MVDSLHLPEGSESLIQPHPVPPLGRHHVPEPLQDKELVRGGGGGTERGGGGEEDMKIKMKEEEEDMKTKVK